MSDRVFRYDVGQVSFEPTPSGGMRGPANLTRTGVFKYRNPDGSIRRELRHPDDVFHADSLASLEDAPLTDGHPREGMVTPDNYKRLAIGHVRGAKSRGQFLEGIAVVQDGACVREVKDRRKGELSCGYESRVIAESGEYNGERYDMRQTEIRYNHVALLPPGAGRAGSEVRLRLDGNEEPTCLPDDEEAKGESMTPAEIAKLMTEAQTEKARADAAVSRADAADKLANEAKIRADKAEGERDAAKAKTDKLEADLKAEREGMSARVDARVNVIAKASKMLPSDFAFAGKSNREIQEAALKATAPKFDAKDRSDDYVSARFDAASEHVGEAVSGLRVKPTPKPAGKTERADDGDDEGDDVPPWQQPLAAHR